MKIRIWLPIVAALLVVFAIPAVAEEAQPETPETLVCSAAPAEPAAAETTDAEEAVETLEPLPIFQAIAQCNCTLGQPCSVPCPSPDLHPRCVDIPCLSISSQLNGVCKCV